MPITVKMPDGTIIRNVPEGTTRAQLMARYGKAQPAKRPGQSFGVGLADSVTSGFLDEVGAVADTLGIGGSGEQRPNIFKGDGFGDAYRQNRDRNRQVIDQKRKQDPGGFLTGQISGALLPVPGGKAVLATRAGQALKAAQTGKKIGVAAKVGKVAANVAPDVARGALYGAGSAEGDLAQRATGARDGAAMGIGGHVAGRALGATVSRALKGKTVSAAVRELHEAGIVMTPGQRAGPGSVRKGLEEGVLGSLPIVRSIPNAAKRRGIEQLNIAAINKALAPIGATLPKGSKPGRELVAKAGDMAYSAYDASVSGLTLGNDSGLKGAANGIIKGGKASVGPGSDQLNAIVARTLSPLEKGPVSGGRVRGILSDLRGEASDFARSTTANERRIGQELWKLHDHIDAALVRQNKGGAVDGFKKAREAVSNFKRIEAAAAKSADGVFSPTQLQQAVTKRGFGTTTAKVARGEAPLQSLSDAAKQVLPDNLPNSGSPERALAVGLAGGGPSAIGALFDPTMGVATAAPLAGYLPGVDRLLQNLALNRPDLLVKLGLGVERATPALGTAGAMTSLGVNSR